MNKTGLLALLFILFQPAFGQKVQYSHQNIKKPNATSMQLVANIAGSHHLICFNAGKNPVIYVFNSQLQSSATREIDLKLNFEFDIRILPFRDHYLLYFHLPGSSQHYLFMVKPDGASQNISSCLARDADSLWNRSKATFQLINQKEQLSVLSHTYYESIQKIGSTLVRFNKDLIPEYFNRVLFSFDKGTETLSQVMVEGNYLLVLKIRQNDERGHELRILKINLANGHSRENFFDAGPHLYMNAAIRYNPDSTILISALLREPAGNTSVQRVVFLTSLGDTLQQLTPITLLQNQFRKNTADNFLLVGDQQQTWLHMSLTHKPKSILTNRRQMTDYGMEGESLFHIQPNENTGISYDRTADLPTAIRLSMLNKQFKTVKDSLIANNNKIYDVLPGPFARFEMKNKAFLVLIQKFTQQQKGLLMIGTDNTGKMMSQELPVYERYDYNLSLLKAVNDEYVIMPFTYKNEVGLVKLSMN